MEQSQQSQQSHGYHLWTKDYITATVHLTASGGTDIVMIGMFPSTKGRNGAVDIITAAVKKYPNAMHGLEWSMQIAGGTINLGFCETTQRVDIAPNSRYIQLCVGDPSGRMPWHPYYDDEWSRWVGQPKIDALLCGDVTRCMRFGCMYAAYKTCSRREVMRYCSEECSAIAWSAQGHKRDCKRGHQVTAAWKHGEDDSDDECSTTEPLEDDPRE